MRSVQFPPFQARCVMWLLSGLAVILALEAPARVQTVTEPLGSASLQGVVVDGATGTVIPGARVAVSLWTNTFTDAQGLFEIPNLAPGSYSLLADVPGRGINRYGEQRPDGNSTGITLTAGQHLRNLRILSWPPATVAGRVVDVDDEPVRGATVEFGRRMFGLASYNTPNYRNTGAATTDATGHYRAELPAGHYLVTVRPTNVTIPASVQNAYHQELSRRGAGTFVSDRLQLSRAPLITGRGIRVGEFFCQVMAGIGPRVVDAPRPAGDAARTYRARAREVALQSGLEATVDFQLDAVPTFTVSGVVDGAKGGGLVAVRLTSMSEPYARQFSIGPPINGETAIGITDVGGRFTMLRVPAGRYEVFVHVDPDDSTLSPVERRQAGTAQSARAELIVNDADVQNLILNLRPTPTVTGLIEFVGDMPPTGAQKAVMRFGLYEDLLSSIPKSFPAFVRQDGSFQFSGQVPGRYWPEASLGSWAIRHITINGQPFDDQIITLGDESLSGIRVTAMRWNAHAGVYGSVELRGAEPVEVTVTVFATDYAQRIADGIFSSRRARFQRLGPSGFNIGYLLPGDYYVVAYREADGEDPTKEFFDKLASRAVRVTAGDGEPVFVPLTLAAVAR